MKCVVRLLADESIVNFCVWLTLNLRCFIDISYQRVLKGRIKTEIVIAL